MECSPAEMRDWVRGNHPLFQDPRFYFSEVPKLEFETPGMRQVSVKETD
jgi:hypothetical protein